MSRRNITKKHYPLPDSKYNSLLVSLFTARILKNGKKRLANSIVLEALSLVKKKTLKNPITIFENAVKNTTPLVEIKSRRIGGSTYQIPLEISNYKGTAIALRWIIKTSKMRSGRAIPLKLASEIIDAAKGVGNATKKREEIHRIAEANKAFAHFRY